MINRTPARDRPSALGWREAPSTAEASNVDGGKGLSLGQMHDAMRDREIGQPNNSEKCSKAADGVTREGEGEAGYRVYALYDKISRTDILAHAYAQCRSNKGAPGVDGPDFAHIEAYRSNGDWQNWRWR
jgi:hypothetical protein